MGLDSNYKANNLEAVMLQFNFLRIVFSKSYSDQ